MKLLYCIFTISCTTFIFILDWATASNNIFTSLHNFIYTLIKCLLNYFINKYSFLNNEVYKYSSSISNIRWTYSGLTIILSLISTEDISNYYSIKLKLSLLRWSDKTCQYLCHYSVCCRFSNLKAMTFIYASY